MTSNLYKRKATRFELTEINIQEADNRQLITISNQLSLALKTPPSTPLYRGSLTHTYTNQKH